MDTGKLDIGQMAFRRIPQQVPSSGVIPGVIPGVYYVATHTPNLQMLACTGRVDWIPVEVCNHLYDGPSHDVTQTAGTAVRFVCSCCSIMPGPQKQGGTEAVSGMCFAVSYHTHSLLFITLLASHGQVILCKLLSLLWVLRTSVSVLSIFALLILSWSACSCIV